MGSTEPMTLCLTPRGHLALVPAGGAPALATDHANLLDQALARGSGHGLRWLGAREVGTALPPVAGYWRDVGARV